MQEVIVVNKNPSLHKDGYAGIQYTFPLGEKVTVSLDAAVHMFGLGLADKANAMKRLGYTNRERGMEFLGKFDISVVDLVPQDIADEADGLKIALEEKGAAVQAANEQSERLAEQLNAAFKDIKKLTEQNALLKAENEQLKLEAKTKKK